MKNIQRKTDLTLIALINDLKAAERDTGAAIWRDVAERLEKPRKNWAETNLSKLDRYANDEEPLQNDVDFLAKYSIQNRFVDYAGRIVLNDKDVPVFNFGKHKGRPVTEVFTVEPSYYNWMMEGDFTRDTKKVIEEIKISMR